MDAKLSPVGVSLSGTPSWCRTSPEVWAMTGREYRACLRDAEGAIVWSGVSCRTKAEAVALALAHRDREPQP
jgi:hypothetical protein